MCMLVTEGHNIINAWGLEPWNHPDLGSNVCCHLTSISPLFLTQLLTLGKSPNLSESQFPFLENRDNDDTTYTSG